MDDSPSELSILQLVDMDKWKGHDIVRTSYEGTMGISSIPLVG